MWDIIQNIIIFSIVMTIVRLLVKGIFKLILIGIVIMIIIYGINQLGIINHINLLLYPNALYTVVNKWEGR